MMREHFTSTEIAGIIHEMGYKARIDEGEKFTRIESASSGARWTVQLGGHEPFFNSMYISMAAWTKRDPLLWCNVWNSHHVWSSAHIIMAAEHEKPIPDSDGDFSVIVSTGHDFEGGTSESHLIHCFKTWITAVDEVIATEDIILVAAPESRHH